MPAACQPIVAGLVHPHHVLRGHAVEAAGLAELVPGLRLVHPQAGQIRRAARLHPGRAQRVGSMVRAVLVQHGAVARELQLDLCVRPGPSPAPCRRSPASPPSGPDSGTRSGWPGWSRRRRGLRCRCRRSVRPHAPYSLWPIDTPGSTGSPPPIDVPSRRHQVHPVAQRRCGNHAVRVVGQNRKRALRPRYRSPPSCWIRCLEIASSAALGVGARSERSARRRPPRAGARNAALDVLGLEDDRVAKRVVELEHVCGERLRVDDADRA